VGAFFFVLCYATSGWLARVKQNENTASLVVISTFLYYAPHAISGALAEGGKE
jgi:hypothetical protein